MALGLLPVAALSPRDRLSLQTLKSRFKNVVWVEKTMTWKSEIMGEEAGPRRINPPIPIMTSGFSESSIIMGLGKTQFFNII